MPMTSPIPLSPVRQKDFAKTYSLDLVVAPASIYELKTVREWAGEHEAQWLNLPKRSSILRVAKAAWCHGYRWREGTKSSGGSGGTCVSPETAFWVTGLTEGTVDYEHHLRALLGLTPLRTIQWVDLARRRVQLASLNK